MVTFNYDQKQMVKQNKLDSILKSCYPLLVTNTTIKDKDTIQVTLPDLKFLPDGEEDKTSITIPGPDSSTWRIHLWRVIKKNELRIILQGVEYSSAFEEEASTVLTIKQGRIFEISTGDFTITKDFPIGKQSYYCL